MFENKRDPQSYSNSQNSCSTSEEVQHHRPPNWLLKQLINLRARSNWYSLRSRIKIE